MHPKFAQRKLCLLPTFPTSHCIVYLNGESDAPKSYINMSITYNKSKLGRLLPSERGNTETKCWFLLNKNSIYLSCITLRFDTLICSEMITVVKLIGISTCSQSYLCVCVCGESSWIYSLSKFSVSKTVLLTNVITLYIRSLDLFILPNCNCD